MEQKRIRVRPPEWRKALMGTAGGFLTMLISIALVAGMVSREAVGIAWINGSAPVVLIVSSFVAAKLAGELMDAAAAVLGELVVLFALNWLLFDGIMEGIGVTALALLGGFGAAFLLRGKGRKRLRRRRSGIKNR